MQLCVQAADSQINEPMVPLCRECSIKEALSIMSLLEARQIQAYYEFYPHQLDSEWLIKGCVVVSPGHYLEAFSLLSETPSIPLIQN